MSRFGQSGYAVLAKDLLEIDDGGVAGDREEEDDAEDLLEVDDAGDRRGADEVVDGGDMGDLYGMLRASLKARDG